MKKSVTDSKVPLSPTPATKDTEATAIDGSAQKEDHTAKAKQPSEKQSTPTTSAPHAFAALTMAISLEKMGLCKASDVTSVTATPQQLDKQCVRCGHAVGRLARFVPCGHMACLQCVDSLYDDYALPPSSPSTSSSPSSSSSSSSPSSGTATVTVGSSICPTTSAATAGTSLPAVATKQDQSKRSDVNFCEVMFWCPVCRQPVLEHHVP